MLDSRLYAFCPLIREAEMSPVLGHYLLVISRIFVELRRRPQGELAGPTPRAGVSAMDRMVRRPPVYAGRAPVLAHDRRP